jgi:hypothetical protein
MREVRPITRAVAPAPTGDDLDVLLDECCVVIENMFRAFKTPTGGRRLHSDLTQDAGQHSMLLTDGMSRWDTRQGHAGVRSWISEGTLRSKNELTVVLNAFYTDMTRKVRLRKISPDWQLDNDALIVLSSRFGLPAPKTFEELTVKQTADQAEREHQRQQQRAADAERERVYMASPEYAEKKRQDDLRRSKKELVEDTLLLMVPYVTFKDKENRTKEELLEADIAHDDRKHLKRYVEYIIEHTSFAPSTIAKFWKDTEDELADNIAALADRAGIPEFDPEDEECDDEISEEESDGESQESGDDAK